MKASTKKCQVTAWSGMSCSLQTIRLDLYFSQQGYESLWVAYWLFAAYSGNLEQNFLCWRDVWTVMSI